MIIINKFKKQTMKKQILFFISLMFVSLFTIGQTSIADTTEKGLFFKPKKKQSPFTSEFGLSTSNLWRGMDVGKQPVIKMEADYQPISWFTLNSEACVVYNQFKDGYGNTVKNGMFFNVYNTSIGVQDVYFNQNTPTQSDTSFFHFDKATTNHFFEFALKYKGDYKSRIDFLASYVFYQNEAYKKGAAYIEATYHLDYNADLFIGYVTGESQLNFQSKAGFTNVGVVIKRTLQFSKTTDAQSRLTIMVNPMYKTSIVPNSTVANRPITANLQIMF
jgi:hypothetical protein